MPALVCFTQTYLCCLELIYLMLILLSIMLLICFTCEPGLTLLVLCVFPFLNAYCTSPRLPTFIFFRALFQAFIWFSRSHSHFLLQSKTWHFIECRNSPSYRLKDKWTGIKIFQGELQQKGTCRLTFGSAHVMLSMFSKVQIDISLGTTISKPH